MPRAIGLFSRAPASVSTQRPLPRHGPGLLANANLKRPTRFPSPGASCPPTPALPSCSLTQHGVRSVRAPLEGGSGYRERRGARRNELHPGSPVGAGNRGTDGGAEGQERTTEKQAAGARRRLQGAQATGEGQSRGHSCCWRGPAGEHCGVSALSQTLCHSSSWQGLE